MRYAANGMPMAEKPVPPPKKEEQKVVEQVKEENVSILNDDIEEGNVSTDNE